MTDINQFAQQALQALEARGRLRHLRESARAGVHLRQAGQEYISFACNDYLGLSQHPRVIEAARAATRDHGAGAGAARLVSGNHALHAPLESAIARHKATEAALLFGSGYLTNIGVIPALVRAGDLLLVDKLSHACILDGAQLSGATVKRFRHNDLAHVQALLNAHRGAHRHALIVTDHIFSMDGDRAPLAELSALARAHNSWLMADDAHGIGFFADHAAQGVDVWMGTLSKALGSYGGYIAAGRAVVDYITSRARSFIFTTGLPPAACAAALAAFEIMEHEPHRAARAHAHACHVAQACGLPQPAAAVLPIVVGSEQAAMAASAALMKHGILAVAIRPPTVPPGTARLRLAFSCAHADSDVARLIAALKTEKIIP